MYRLYPAPEKNIQAVDNKGEIDRDVKIYVDGKYLSDGTASYFAVPFLELKKEGCKTQREKLEVKLRRVTYLKALIF